MSACWGWHCLSPRRASLPDTAQISGHSRTPKRSTCPGTTIASLASYFVRQFTFVSQNCDISREYSIIFWFCKSQYLFADFCRILHFHNNNQNICFDSHYVNQLIHMLFHVDNVDNFVHNLIFQHFFIFLKVENFLPINSPIHIFFKSLCNLLISTLFDIFPCKISYLQYLTKYTQINFILSLFPFVSWQAPATVQKGRGNLPRL